MKRALGLGVALTAGIVAMAAPSQADTLRLGAAVASNRAIEFEVILPLHNEAGLDALLAAQQDPNSHYSHQWLTPASFAAQFGPDAATKQKAADSLSKFGLSVSVRSRSLHVSGIGSNATNIFQRNMFRFA